MIVQAVFNAQLFSDSLAQLRNACRWRIMSEAFIECPLGCIANVLRRVEIRLTNGEGHNVLALGAQLTGFLRHADDGTFIS